MDIRQDDPTAPHVADLLDFHLRELRDVMGEHTWTPLAEMYTDVRHLCFADGPDEVHWMVVGRHELSMQ